MRILLDQGLPRSTANILRAAGVDAVHVGEIGLATADDATILKRGQDEDRVVVTLDADFHSLMAFSGAAKPSVIRIRDERLRAEALADLLLAAAKRCQADLEAGSLVSVRAGRLRLRKLPLIRRNM